LKALALAVLALSLIAVAGCGGGGNDNNASTTTSTTQTSTTPSGSAGGASTVKISADPSGALKFDKDKLSAKSGKVTITMDNPSPVAHAVAIKGGGASSVGKTVDKGGVSTATADLKPGSYEFYCPVDGHEQAGMKGTLTVK
jgi:plastocyanin